MPRSETLGQAGAVETTLEVPEPGKVRMDPDEEKLLSSLGPPTAGNREHITNTSAACSEEENV